MSTQPLVLFVDDDPHMVSAIRRALKGVAATVVTASSAEEALQVLEGADPAMVVSDYQMGEGLDGATFLERIRERFPGARLVLHTGTLNLEGNVNFEVWPKPVSSLAFRKAVEDLAASPAHR